jgi:hypothetical protein
VRIQFAHAEGASLGRGRNDDLLHPPEERRKKQHRRTHADGHFGLELVRVKSGVIDPHLTTSTVPRYSRSLDDEECDQFLKVGDIGHIQQAHRSVGEKRGAEDGQDGILVPGRNNGAGERPAAIDDKIGHGSAGNGGNSLGRQVPDRLQAGRKNKKGIHRLVDALNALRSETVGKA